MSNSDTLNFPIFSPASTMARHEALETVEQPAEPKKRGPRRQSGDSGNYMPPQKRKGRPKKKAVAPTAAPNLSSLFQILAGLQSDDVVPLTSCYELLAALPPEGRSRVLGMLNKVLA